MYKTGLGFSPLTNKIYLGQYREAKGLRLAHPSKTKTDVSNEAAQYTWMLVEAEGGKIQWQRQDGKIMTLTATLEDPSNAD